MNNNPDQTLIVLFGESHLASNHLPARVRTLRGRKQTRLRELLVFQNIDALYWKLQEGGFDDTRAVQVREACYCVFNATPIEKYESFRRYLHKCIEEDPSGDWTLLAETLLEIVTDFFAIKKTESLVNYMPALNGGHLSSAAEEFARRIHQACRGELEQPRARAAEDEFFVKVIENGLGYFCSKLLDSSRDGIESLAGRVLTQIGRDDRLTKAVELLVNPGKRPGAQHFAALRGVIEKKAGKPFREVMLETFVRPLGMSSTFTSPDEVAVRSRLAQPYTRYGDEAVRTGAPDDAPHAVLKLYWPAWPQSTWTAHESAFKKWFSTVDGVERHATPWPDWMITTAVDARAFWPTSLRAVACHESQFSSYARLLDFPEEEQEALWGWQYYYRVFSLVNGGRARETHLFEGIADP